MRRYAPALVGLLVAIGCALGIGVPATYAGHVAVDEPEYLLTALSLGEDADLSISDELGEERYRDFHKAGLPQQTRVLDGGRQVSPHDPLLPAVLAVPMRLGGWVAAKLALAAMAGALAALLVWTAVRRFEVPLPLAAGGVLLACLSPPLAVYGTQVYPELPAALAVTVAVAALTGPRTRGTTVALVGAVVALPWLSVKYVPVAAVLALLGPRTRNLFVSYAVAGLGYVVAHRLLYGGWTVYATADHFVGTGELGVVGSPDLLGRATRLSGLLVDREFGLVPWQPAYALLPLARPRRELVLPLLAGWLTATFVALTMHGYWWPGRQVVVVLPCAVLALLCWAARLDRARWAVAALGGLGVLAYGWLLADGWAGRLTWVTGFAGVGDPAYRLLRPLLPDYRNPGPGTWALHAAWALLLLLPLRKVLSHVALPARLPRPARRPRRV